MEIPNLLKKLSFALRKKDLSGDELDFTLKIISSSICSAISMNVFEIEEKIKKKLYLHNQISEAIEVSSIIHKHKQQVDNRILCNILDILYLLSGKQNKIINFDFGKYLNYNYEDDLTYQHIKNTLQKPPSITPNFHFMKYYDSNSIKQDNQNNQKVLTKSTNGSYKLYRLENLLLKDLTRVMIDIDGNYLKISKPKWTLVYQNLPQEKDKLEPGMYEQILRIGECGWLFSQVETFVKENSEPHKGRVLQALSAALQSKFVDYYKFIALIYSMVRKDLESLDSHLKDNSPPSYLDWITSPEMTVKRLLATSTKMMHHLQILAMIVKDCQGLKGCELLAVLYTLSFNGDPHATTLIRQILVSCCKPLTEFIIKWITQGILSDNYREFFIEDVLELTQRDPWTERYGINQKMIPPFLAHKLISQIYSTGKSVYFLKEVCHIFDFKVPEQLSHTKSESSGPGSVEIFDPRIGDVSAQFESYTKAQYSTVGSRLTQHILEELSLNDNLRAIRDYLLLGRGDFSYHLIYLLEKMNASTSHAVTTKRLHQSNSASSGGGPYVSRDRVINSSGTFLVQQMVDVLSEAIRSSNALHERPEIMDRLTVCFKTKNDNSDVPIWETFGLKYMVEGPLTVVLTNKNLHKYQALFLVAWRTKWLGYMLHKCWRRQKNYPKALRTLTSTPTKIPAHGSMKGIGSLIHSCQILGTMMSHFIQQIQYYFNFEVMICAWEDLTKRLLSPALDLDDVIRAHETYLSHLTAGFLLGPGCKIIYTHLLSLYDLILQFLNLHSTIHKRIKSSMQYYKTSTDTKNANRSRIMSSVALNSTFYCFDDNDAGGCHRTISGDYNTLTSSHEAGEELDRGVDQVDRMATSNVMPHLPTPNDKSARVSKVVGGHRGTKANHDSNGKSTKGPLDTTSIKSLYDKVSILRISFKDLVKDFLLMLVDKPGDDKDIHLFYLSFRLDFNDYYKNRDSRLRSSLTFESRLNKSQHLRDVTHGMCATPESVFSEGVVDNVFN